MSLLLRLERRLESLVEGLFSHWARDRVHPVEIGRRLLRAMDEGAVAGLSGMLVPNDYQVFLNSQDFAPYTSFTEPLVRELEDALRARAQELRAQLPGPVRITLGARDEITAGEIYVEAKLAPASAQAAAAGDAPAPAGDREAGGGGKPSAVPTDTRVYRREPGAARIRIQAGPPGAAGREFALDRPVLTIGRRADQDIVLNDPSISRAHARIEVTAEGVSIADLDSTNGTFVNGHPVRTERAALRPGDRIQVGIVLLEYLTGA